MRKSNYDKRPVLHVRTKGVSAWQGWEAIGAQLRKAIAGKPDAVVCVDCYHGVWEADVLSALTEQLNPSHVFCTAQATLPNEQVNAMLKDHLTDDRVFGIMAHYRIEQFFDMERVAALRQEIALVHGVRLVFGVGAALLCEHPDVLVYADMARWEIQLRFRSGKLANWLNDNYDEDPLRKYKRGYFIEWRVLDRHKRTLHSHIDYLLDTNDAEMPRMMTGDCYRDALKQAVTQPFRVAPYFDPGVWGGQWMKSVCGLDPEKPNYAWSFDGVPEENSLLLDVDGIVVETPAINLVHEEAKALLGDKVHARFAVLNAYLNLRPLRYHGFKAVFGKCGAVFVRSSHFCKAGFCNARLLRHGCNNRKEIAFICQIIKSFIDFFAIRCGGVGCGCGTDGSRHGSRHGAA